MVETFFKYFSTIDVHDHLRQGSLALEGAWPTRCWWHRVFSTVLGMCVVDAYFAYQFEHDDLYILGEPMLDFNDFLEDLVYELVDNDYFTTGVDTRQEFAPLDACVEVIVML